MDRTRVEQLNDRPGLAAGRVEPVAMAGVLAKRIYSTCRSGVQPTAAYSPAVRGMGCFELRAVCGIGPERRPQSVSSTARRAVVDTRFRYVWKQQSSRFKCPAEFLTCRHQLGWHPLPGTATQFQCLSLRAVSPRCPTKVRSAELALHSWVPPPIRDTLPWVSVPGHQGARD